MTKYKNVKTEPFNANKNQSNLLIKSNMLSITPSKRATKS